MAEASAIVTGDGGAGGTITQQAAGTGGSQAGATSTQAASGQAASTTGGAQTDWTTGLNDEYKSYVQTKGFKAPQDVLESYRNYEKLQGVPQERLLKLPENLDSPEGRALFERLGAPKEAKEYNIEIPKENGDPKLAEFMRETFFKNGVTKKQAEGIVKAWNETQGASIQQMMAAKTAESAAQAEKLKTDWGQAYDQNLNISRQAVQNLGWKKEQIDALQGSLGYDGVMKLLHTLGTATGEHQFVGGKSGGGMMHSTESAQAKIAELISDKSFTARLNAKDVDAIKQWDQLHQAAYPGTISL